MDLPFESEGEYRSAGRGNQATKMERHVRSPGASMPGELLAATLGRQLEIPVREQYDDGARQQCKIWQHSRLAFAEFTVLEAQLG